jgi:hypothetical protein
VKQSQISCVFRIYVTFVATHMVHARIYQKTYQEYILSTSLTFFFNPTFTGKRVLPSTGPRVVGVVSEL